MDLDPEGGDGRVICSHAMFPKWKHHVNFLEVKFVVPVLIFWELLTNIASF